MMDPITLAGAALGLLTPFFKAVGDKIMEAGAATAVDKVRALYERIRGRVGGDPYDEHLLHGVRADPDSAARRRNLQERLQELLTSDDAFRADVARLVQDAEAAGATTVTATRSGITAGGNVSQVAGGDAVGRDKTVSGREAR
jgi:hypothetical protein